MGGHVKKIFLLKFAENYFSHTTQNSEALKKPFFCYKKFRWWGEVNHPPPHDTRTVNDIFDQIDPINDVFFLPKLC